MLLRALLFALSLALLTPANQVRAEEENPIVTLVKTKVKDPGQPFGMTVTFKVRAGAEQSFEEAFTPCVAATRKEPGNLAYFLNRDVEDPSSFLVFERFKSIAALEAHAKTAHVAELLKQIGPLLAGPPSVKVYGVAGQ